ncbi:MAG: hypothetical protein ACFCU1_07635 [Sumerlaeia bacterium]
MSNWNQFKPVGREERKENPNVYLYSLASWAVLGAVAGWLTAWFIYARISVRSYHYTDYDLITSDQMFGEYFTTSGAVIGLFLGLGLGLMYYWQAKNSPKKRIEFQHSY